MTACMPQNNTISLCVQVDRSKVVDSLTADDLHVIMQAEDEVHGYTACVRTHYNYTVYCNTLYCPDACCGTYSSYTCLYSLQYSVHTPRPIVPSLQLSRCGEFERVFPCSNYNKYKKFFEVEVTNKFSVHFCIHVSSMYYLYICSCVYTSVIKFCKQTIKHML